MNEWKEYEMQELVDEFTDNVNNDPQLKAYRDWIEENAFGFGERCFLWMWKEIVDRMPKSFTFVEVGVFRGQILALVKMLADRTGKKVKRYGITPLDSTDGHVESYYMTDIQILHDTFNIPKDFTILQGLSTDEAIIKDAKKIKANIVYIDGGHAYDVVKSDLKVYPKIVKSGGYLVIDDCNNAIDMPWGYFRGIDTVSKAVDEMFPPYKDNAEWNLEMNIVHNRILKKI